MPKPYETTGGGTGLFKFKRPLLEPHGLLAASWKGRPAEARTQDDLSRMTENLSWQPRILIASIIGSRFYRKLYRDGLVDERFMYQGTIPVLFCKPWQPFSWAELEMGIPAILVMAKLDHESALQLRYAQTLKDGQRTVAHLLASFRPAP